jgi:hypothetical protein
MNMRYLLSIAALLLAFVAGAWTGPTVAESALLNGDAAAVSVLEDESELTFVCDASERDCALARTMLETFPYPWAVLDYEVVIRSFDEDEWVRGLAIPDERRIELFVDEDTTLEALAATFAHEVGHALHQICGDDILDVWRERRGIDGDVPNYVPPPHDYDSVAEDFAEAMRQFLGFGESLSTVGPTMTGEWLHMNADMFVPGKCPGI